MTNFMIFFFKKNKSTGGADLLDATRIRDIPLGVEKATGFCNNRVQNVVDEESIIGDPNAIRPGPPFSNRTDPFQTGPDQAYGLSATAVLSVPTGQLFPEGFPTDFSILATFKPLADSRFILLSVYNDAGDEQLAIEVNDRIHLIYQVTEIVGFFNEFRLLKAKFSLRKAKMQQRKYG